MFFCEPCRKKWRWPESMSRSRGRCEMCEKPAVCYDVPSRFLPDPIGVLTEQEVIDGAADAGQDG